MARRDLRSNALDALMGGAPTARPAKESPPPTDAPDQASPAPTAAPVESGAPQVSKTAVPKKARAAEPKPAEPKKGPTPKTDGVVPAPDGYVGRSRYKRKKRGVVAKLAVHLSPDVADALRRAGAVGDENGSNMSEIVEALLRRAGYGGEEGG